MDDLRSMDPEFSIAGHLTTCTWQVNPETCGDCHFSRQMIHGDMMAKRLAKDRLAKERTEEARSAWDSMISRLSSQAESSKEYLGGNDQAYMMTDRLAARKSTSARSSQRMTSDPHTLFITAHSPGSQRRVCKADQ